MNNPPARIAISGHRGLPAATAALIDRDIRAHLQRFPGRLIGLSCLADGADQIFAGAVLDLGGALEVVIPADNYRAALPPDCWAQYDALLGKASRIIALDHVEPTSRAFMDASARMIIEADELLAVWDGKEARGYGGTADVVAYARKQRTPVHIVWPAGASRD